MIDPLLLAHRALHGVLPLSLALRRLVADGYQRQLIAYQRDFLRRLRDYPDGVEYRLLACQQVTPHSRAYHLLAPPGVVHQCGDTLLLDWCNAETEVQSLLAARDWSASQRFRFRTASSAFRPGTWLTTELQTALREHVEIRSPAPIFCPTPVPEDAALTGHNGSRLNLAASLARLSAAQDVSPEAVLAHQPRIKPRSYSVTNIEHSPSGEVVEILVSDVSDTLIDVDGKEKQVAGRSSGYLASLRPNRDVIRGWPLDFPLSLQTQGTRHAPLLVIATGIAVGGPLCELQAHQSNRPLWLVCGIRHYASGQPFLSRLLDFAASWPDCRLDIALSRDAVPAGQDGLPSNCFWHGHSRVQGVLDTERERFGWHVERGGDTVIIGHTSMGAAVQNWLREFFISSGHAGDERAAAERLRSLERTLKVQYSLSGR
jgi:sulfite reductase alpha subunit-like flavoprotein